jgi:hypothetical protein
VRKDNNKLIIKICTVTFHPRKSSVFCSDNRGNLYVFSTETGALEMKKPLTTQKINHMEIDSEGAFLALVLSDGIVFILDERNNFDLCLTLEERINHSLQTRKVKSKCAFLRGSSRVASDPNIWMTHPENNDIKVITLKNQNTLRLHQLEKVDLHKYSSYVVASFYTEGKYRIFE